MVSRYGGLWAGFGDVAAGGLAAPVNTGAPEIPGAAIIGHTVAVVPGTYNVPCILTYECFLDGVAIPNWAHRFYEIQDIDEGKDLYFEETATNSAGPTVTSSNTIGPIALPAPGQPVMRRLSDSGVGPVEWETDFTGVYPGNLSELMVGEDAGFGVVKWHGHVELTQEMIAGTAPRDYAANGIPQANPATDDNFGPFDQTGWPAELYFKERAVAVTPLQRTIESAWSELMLKTDADIPMTMNQSDSVNTVVSGGGLTCTMSGGARIRSSRPMPNAGLIYGEGIITSNGQFLIFGLQTAEDAIMSGGADELVYWHGAGGTTYGGGGAGAPTLDAGDRFAWAFNWSALRFYTGIVSAGTVTWQGGVDPASGTGGTLCTGIASDLHPILQCNDGALVTMVFEEGDWAASNSPTGAIPA